ncbi:hypothetical protein K8I31_05850 [bacterium]|nr:hypothetical protein [bacterium]
MKRFERLLCYPIGGAVVFAAPGGVYLQGDFVEESENQGPLFLMQATALVCLYIAAVSVIDAFFGLYTYLAFSLGIIDPAQSTDWQRAFEEFQHYPIRTLGFILYNITVWNAVIICAIWMLRRRLWALHNLRRLLSLDMIVTVLSLCWPIFTALIYQTEVRARQMSSPGVFIFVNALQVGAIIVLAHPRVLQAVEGASAMSQSEKEKE